jgi:phosphopantetheinyl transferase (holo-ACP synthase)
VATSLAPSFTSSFALHGDVRRPSSAVALAATVPASTGWLTEGERARFELIASAPRRRDWLTSRLAGKRAVASVLGVHDLRRLELRSRPGDAPSAHLRDESGVFRDLSVTVSLAHCDGHGVAAAIGGPRRAGVDVERLDVVHPAHERYFLTAAERASRAGHGTTALWALKEAAWKALRCRDGVVFSALELRFRGDVLRAVALHGTEHRAAAAISYPWPGFVLAVVFLDGEVA